MTCIVGLCDNDKVYIGGDSASCGSTDMTISAAPKVFKASSFVIGYTSSWRMGQILQHHVDFDALEVPGLGESLQEFMVRHFIKAIRKAFREEFISSAC